MSDTEPFVYIHGDFVPASQAKLAIYDAGIVLGATLTDMTRTFGHKPFRLDDHVARFYRSCKYARITPKISAKQTLEVTRQLIERNVALIEESSELGVVHFITPGEFKIYAGAAGMPGDLDPTYCIHSFPLPLQFWKHYYTNGVHVVTPSIRHIPPQCTDPKIKCRSRMHWWLADGETHLVDPKAVSLILDLDGNITETAGSNFGIILNGTVISPPRRNILWGISITTVAELCDQLDIAFIERDIQVHDVINADEAFLSSTPYCLAPVTRINGLSIGSASTKTPVLEKLMAAWSDRVGLDFRRQILDAPVNEQ